MIYGDEVLLNQLIQNLISNSIKYNKTKNPVIHIRARELKNAWIISLEDNGIGIEPQYFKTIFEPFERLHNKAEYEGSGLGLSQCKKIIESHNPLQTLLPTYPEINTLECQMISDLIGVPIKREVTITAGIYRAVIMAK